MKRKATQNGKHDEHFKGPKKEQLPGANENKLRISKLQIVTEEYKKDQTKSARSKNEKQ